MLEIGSPAPDVALHDTDGQTIHLANYQGEQAVLVYFMRSVSCPVCNRHVQDLVRRRDEFAADRVQVLVAVPEDRRAAAEWRARRRIPFRVLVGGTLHEALGLSRKVFGALQQSGSVLIDSLGVVRHVHAATMPTNGYQRREITAAVQALRTRA